MRVLSPQSNMEPQCLVRLKSIKVSLKPYIKKLTTYLGIPFSPEGGDEVLFCDRDEQS